MKKLFVKLDNNFELTVMKIGLFNNLLILFSNAIFGQELLITFISRIVENNLSSEKNALLSKK
jgi:hypothetical protein